MKRKEDETSIGMREHLVENIMSYNEDAIGDTRYGIFSEFPDFPVFPEFPEFPIILLF